METTTTFEAIYKKLKEIDVSTLCKKKKSEGKDYSYIPWAVAWDKIVEIYPDSTIDYLLGRLPKNL